MKAHAPGSVTGFFAPPAEPGGASKGASMAIRDGVVVEVVPAERTRILVDGEERGFAPVEGILERLGVTAAVDVTSQVPIGYGFGASGAATLATALAADAEFDLGADRADLVGAAHRAEVAAGTGLGDVFIQDRGGVIWSTDDGSRRVERSDPVEYTAFAGMATDEVLGDEGIVGRLRDLGEAAFARLPAEPTLSELVSISWEFARGTGLVTDRVGAEVDRVRDAGGEASMAMLGETVFAVDVDGVLEERTRVATAGARLR